MADRKEIDQDVLKAIEQVGSGIKHEKAKSQESIKIEIELTACDLFKKFPNLSINELFSMASKKLGKLELEQESEDESEDDEDNENY